MGTRHKQGLKAKSFMQEAQDSWPEDEARMTAASIESAIIDGECETFDAAQALLYSKVAHMHQVFAESESDMKRYDDALRAELKRFSLLLTF